MAFKTPHQKLNKTVRKLQLGQNNEHLIVGAYALAFHGVPRYTGDLDIFVNPTIDNAEKVIDARVEKCRRED
jgi:hypothetical protein